MPSHIGIVAGSTHRSRGAVHGTIRSGGAIAVLGSGGGRLELTTLDVFDLPLRRPHAIGDRERGTSAGLRRIDLDLARLTALLQIGATPAHAAVQQPRAGRNATAAAVFACGAAHGAVLGALAALRIGATPVYPAVWHRDMALPSGTDARSADALRARASELFPDHDGKWQRVRDVGRAEAALLAEWGRRQQLAGR